MHGCVCELTVECVVHSNGDVHPTDFGAVLVTTGLSDKRDDPSRVHVPKHRMTDSPGLCALCAPSVSPGTVLTVSSADIIHISYLIPPIFRVQDTDDYYFIPSPLVICMVNAMSEMVRRRPAASLSTQRRPMSSQLDHGQGCAVVKALHDRSQCLGALSKYVLASRSNHQGSRLFCWLSDNVKNDDARQVGYRDRRPK